MSDDKTVVGAVVNGGAKSALENKPIPVAIIVGTGDGGPGSIKPGTVAHTPPGVPNVIVAEVVTPLVAVLVRATNTFLTTLLGLLSASMTPAGKVLNAHDLYHTILTCASLSVAATAVGVIKDLITIFGRLEGKYPLATGNV